MCCPIYIYSLSTIKLHCRFFLRKWSQRCNSERVIVPCCCLYMLGQWFLSYFWGIVLWVGCEIHSSTSINQKNQHLLRRHLPGKECGGGFMVLHAAFHEPLWRWTGTALHRVQQCLSSMQKYSLDEFLKNAKVINIGWCCTCTCCACWHGCWASGRGRCHLWWDSQGLKNEV